jgi:hypothetical protein
MSEKRYANVGLRKAVITLACVLVCGLANAADSLDSLPPEVQVDVLMKRITNSILASDYKTALPSFRKLISFNKPLPESFDFFYIEALAETKTNETDQEADARIKQYFSRWGKQGAHYQKVVAYSADVMPRAEAARVAAQQKAEAQAAQLAADRFAARKEYDSAMAQYESDVQSCPSRFREKVEEARRDANRADQACIVGGGSFASFGGNMCDAHEAWNDQYVRTGATASRTRARERLEEINATSSAEWCDGRYTRPPLKTN